MDVTPAQIQQQLLELQELQRQLHQQQPQPHAGQTVQIDAAAKPKIPAFISVDPEFWFKMNDAAFSKSRIVNDDLKFEYIMGTGHDPKIQPYLAAVCREDELGQIPATSSKYKRLKERVIKGFAISADSKLKKLFKGQGLGDRTPSQLLAHMQNVAPGQCSDQVLRSLWTEQLPETVRTILAATPETTTLDELAAIADKIMESLPAPQTISEVKTPKAQSTPAASGLAEAMQRLSEQLEKFARDMAKSQSQLRSRSRSKSRQGRAQTPARTGSNERFCWYHNKFGTKANKCAGDCSFLPEN